jgi:hypothetical protein
VHSGHVSMMIFLRQLPRVPQSGHVFRRRVVGMASILGTGRPLPGDSHRGSSGNASRCAGPPRIRNLRPASCRASSPQPSLQAAISGRSAEHTPPPGPGLRTPAQTRSHAARCWPTIGRFLRPVNPRAGKAERAPAHRAVQVGGLTANAADDGGLDAGLHGWLRARRPNITATGHGSSFRRMETTASCS